MCRKLRDALEGYSTLEKAEIVAVYVPLKLIMDIGDRLYKSGMRRRYGDAIRTEREEELDAR